MRVTDRPTDSATLREIAGAVVAVTEVGYGFTPRGAAEVADQLCQIAARVSAREVTERLDMPLSPLGLDVMDLIDMVSCITERSAYLDRCKAMARYLLGTGPDPRRAVAPPGPILREAHRGSNVVSLADIARPVRVPPAPSPGGGAA